MTSVAVIGGGASGTLAAIQLLRRAARGSTVHLIHNGPEPGRGIAYGTADGHHLLNVRAGRMSAFPDELGDFARWAGVSSQAFVARSRYGDYLVQRLRAAASASPAGFTLVTGEAIAIDERGVTLATGTVVDAHGVVLAIGHATPAPMPWVSSALLASTRYVDDPWAPGALDLHGITNDSHMVILGTALTFVDVVLTLTARFPRLTVLGVSRHGLVPHAHVDRRRQPAPLDDIASAHAGSVNPLARAFIARGRDAGPKWRDVFDGIRPHTTTLWAGFSPTDRRRFLRHGLAFWDNHRHRMASDAGAEIARLLAQETVSVRRGRVISLAAADDGTAMLTGLRGGEVLRSDVVIRCTGASGRFTADSSPLVRDLLSKGMHLDPYGLGFVVNETGRIRFNEAHHMPPVHVIGPARRGSEWESTAIPGIRRQADAAARELLNSRFESAPRPYRDKRGRR